MELGSSVWEDEGTLHWNLRIAEDVEVPGGTSIQVHAFAKGPQPQVQQLKGEETTNRYDLKLGVGLGVKGGTVVVPGYTALLQVVECYPEQREDLGGAGDCNGLRCQQLRLGRHEVTHEPGVGGTDRPETGRGDKKERQRETTGATQQRG